MADGFAATPDLDRTAPMRRSFRVADLDAMFDAGILSRSEKLELIDGEIIQMNAQMLPHLTLKSRLAGVLARKLRPDLEVSIEGSVHISDTTLIEPDLIVTHILPTENRYVRAEEVGLAIEIANSSLPYDLGGKALIYAKAKIGELWVVDIKGRQTYVHRSPAETGYESVVTIDFGAPLQAQIDGAFTVVMGQLVR